MTVEQSQETAHQQLRGSYAAAGVDIDAANSAVARMKAHIASTRRPGVLSRSAGNFGGMFSLAEAAQGMREPVLVSSIDGVGTKLKLAFRTGRHESVAGDLVNHCVNDILVQGARPLFFLDYYATGKLDPEVAVEIVAGLSAACRAAECTLIGGETAEMPGLYAKGEYDLAGTIVGLVDRERLVTGDGIQEGDILIGLPSVGLHTNGYALAQHALFEQAGRELKSPLSDDPYTGGEMLEDALLAPHRCYAPSVLPILNEMPSAIRGMAHITGGGLLENVPRALPDGLAARIDQSAWTPLPIFAAIQQAGNIDSMEMHRVFNMGIGFVLIVAQADADAVMQELHGGREDGAMRLGTVVPGSGVILV